MTQEDKKLLFKDLCARLHYGVKIKTSNGDGILCSIDYIPDGAYLGVSINGAVKEYFEYQDTRPYLRPMSSMTEEERIEFTKLFYKWHDDELFDYIEEGAEFSIWKHKGISPVVFDWLNAHHFDYRGFIPMGLALEAPEGMYKTE